MQVIPASTSLGDILGRGLSEVATAWAEHKTTTNALKKLGFSDAHARAYSHLGPQIQQQAVHAKQQQQAQEREAAVTAAILNGGQSGSQPQQPFQAQSQATPYQGLPKTQLPHEQQQAAIQQATSIAQNPNFRKLNEQQQQAQALQNKQLTQGPAPAARQATPEQAAILQSQALEAKKEPPFKERLENVIKRRQALISAPISPTQKREVHKLLQDEESAIREEMKEARKDNREDKKEEHKDQREANKETLETYTKTVDSYKAARESNATLDRMQKLVDKGSLPHAATVSAVNFLRDGIKLGKFGSIVSLDVSALLGGDAQEFDKLSRGMLRNGKEIFGSRMTDYDVDTFLKMIPSLAQTNEGKQRIINTLRAWNDASLLRYDAMKEIIKENGNKRPPHLDMLIEDRIGNKLDSLYGKFAEGYGPKNPPATRSLLGDVASTVSQLVFPR